jgi:hypothetical protein
MKQIKIFYTAAVLLFLSLGFSSCYIGLYSPGVRCVNGPRYRSCGPRYHHAPAQPYHHHGGYSRR